MDGISQAMLTFIPTKPTFPDQKKAQEVVDTIFRRDKMSPKDQSLFNFLDSEGEAADIHGKDAVTLNPLNHQSDPVVDEMRRKFQETPEHMKQLKFLQDAKQK